MVTIREIAEQLGMSTTTVSNVIHGKTKEVSEQTVAKVEAALRRMNYVPNINARNLAQNRSKIIGLVMKSYRTGSVSMVADPFVGEMVGAIEQTVRKAGYYLMFLVSDDVKEITSWLSSWNIDGLLVLGVLGDEGKTILEQYKKPVVFIDAYFEDPPEDYCNVGLEDERGAADMTRFLIGKGHRAVTFFTESVGGPNKSRYDGFAAALKEAGIPVTEERLFLYDSSPDKSEDLLDKAAACVREGLVTAYFCTSDHSAMVLINALTDRGLKVPEDVSVAGFDDIPIVRFFRPALTTVRQDVDRKGTEAAELLLTLTEGKPVKEKRIVLTTEVIERNTVRDIR